MPREFRDLAVNEIDGKVRYNLIDREGVIVAKNVQVVVASEVLQQGDQFGASAVNLYAELDDDGTPLMKTVKLENGGTGRPDGKVPALLNPRTIRTNLANSNAPSFDGTASITPGVTGILGVGNGGTGRDDGIAWGNVVNKPNSYPPSAHSQGWDTITGKPSTFTPSAHTQGWNTITDKPSTFTPSAHNQGASTITAGVFPGQVEAAYADYAGRKIRNTQFQDSAGNDVYSYALLTRRK